jgi:hypothetical protein
MFCNSSSHLILVYIEIDHLSHDEHYKTITEMKQFDPISLKHR